MTKNTIPKFITIFTDVDSEIYRLGLLSKDQNQFLLFALNHVKSTNRIDLTRYIKEEIIKEIYETYNSEELTKTELSKKIKSADKFIAALLKAEVFMKLRDGEVEFSSKKGTGSYVLNPFIYGKGSWKNILLLREEVSNKRREAFLGSEEDGSEDDEELGLELE